MCKRYEDNPKGVACNKNYLLFIAFVLCAQGFRPQGAPGFPGMQMRPGGVSGASSYPGAMAGLGTGPMHRPPSLPGLPGPPGSGQAMPQQLRPPMPLGGSAGANPNVWTEHTAPDGRKYYHNKALNKSSWEKPAELLSPKVPCSTSPAILPTPASLVHANHRH